MQLKKSQLLNLSNSSFIVGVFLENMKKSKGFADIEVRSGGTIGELQVYISATFFSQKSYPDAI